MEPTDGETRRSDGQPCPPLRKLQGKKTGKPTQAGDTSSGLAILPNGGEGNGAQGTARPTKDEELAAIRPFLQALFKSVTTAIMLFLSGSLTTAEILHPFTHKAGGGHKTPPITNTTRREDRGETGFEIQHVADEDDGGNPAGGPPLVPCEAVGVGCSNRVPSGFCHFRQHLCIVAPHPDFLMSLEPVMDLVLRDYLPKVAGKKTKPPDTKWIHRGRLHYEAGCNQLYVGGEYFNLENNARARWCMVLLTERGAFEPETACHFVDEIDVFVRGKTSFAASPNVRIHEYFRDAGGRLDYLLQLLFRSDWGSGKYYLLTRTE